MKHNMVPVAVLLAGILIPIAPGAAAEGSPHGSSSAAACASMARTALPDTKIQHAKWFEPNKQLPAFCEVRATVKTSPTSGIAVVFRLPEQWNGKLVGRGGGGWAGDITLQSAAPGLQAGYATLQTDSGHEAKSFPAVWVNDFLENPEKAKDFAYRAIHLMTVLGKQVIEQYYGRAQQKAYFWGCSTGGRQGLMEAQRYPADYDAVIAAAPVYSLQVQTTAVMRDKLLSAPGAGLSEEKLATINAAVLKACDRLDGVSDGIISDPAMCKWDPARIQCKPGGEGGSCLTPAQVKAVRGLYTGTRASDGRWVSYPLPRGSELSWSRFLGVSNGVDPTGAGGFAELDKLLLGREHFNPVNFEPGRDFPKVMSSPFAKEYNADDPNISVFTMRGGKLLLWHGGYDAGPSWRGTIDYYRAVEKTVPNASESVRLFIAPGVYHCGGGPGPDQVDWREIDKWATSGAAPKMLIATREDHKLSRPLCAYPRRAVYKGEGDTTKAESFTCR